MFRRRRQVDDELNDDRDLDAAAADEPDDELDDEVDDPGDELADEPADLPPVAAAPAAPTGPWDVHDVPEDDTPRLDLGALHVPVPEGLELRVEVEDDVAVAATFVDGTSLLQVHAFAAPKTSGLWDEVRAEIAESLRGDQGSAEDAAGPFGTELRARVPDDRGTAPARFLGVDGPRWFLRGLVTGPAATDSHQARRLEAAFRDVVVDRGADAMAPRDLLPLRLPREAMEQAEQLADAEQPGEAGAAPTLSLPERGPEITEIQ